MNIITRLTQVDNVLGDGLPTLEDVKKLKYTTRVINEVSKKAFLTNELENFLMNMLLHHICCSP
jgi:hypothetical protein